jgi:phosphoribosylformylglycinamidine synthase
VHGTRKALAITTDCTPRYVFADPVEGGKQAVAESWRNLTAEGATPLAITNCLNFGNPEKPEIMGQIVGALQGMREACMALDYPVVSGNVSLYNETNGKGIHPTPAIGGVGILWDVETRASSAFTREGDEIFVVGDTRGHLGCSLYLREILKSEEGAPPRVDLALERKHGEFVRSMVERGMVNACHDIADGGLLVALAEMCMPKGVGAVVVFPSQPGAQQFAFGEDQGRYLISVSSAQAVKVAEAALTQGVSLNALGRTQGTRLEVMGRCSLEVSMLKQKSEAWLPGFMAA